MIRLKASLRNRQKNSNVICNGTSPVYIKTLHGKFQFQLQKYQVDGIGLSYLELTNQLAAGYISPRLQEFSAYYSNRLSYEEVEKLVERVTGKHLLSDQKIWQIVSDKALMVSQDLQRDVMDTLAQTTSEVIRVNSKVDIYNSQSEETLLFDDGIQVKSQKAERQPKAKLVEVKKDQSSLKAKTPVVMTDVVMLQKSTGAFEYITAPTNAEGKDLLSLATVVQAKVIQEYGHETRPLNLVAITDGARVIRNRLLAIFGVATTVILDWYHLCKKLRQLMSMIAINKSEKTVHLKFLIPQLWLGLVDNALEYLRTQVTVRNQEKWSELVGYLEKHSSEIINYNRRRLAGKTIGSGRMEKGVDLTVGRRQKKKAMSWRPLGSRALSLLRIVELNGQWQQLWFPAQAT